MESDVDGAAGAVPLLITLDVSDPLALLSLKLSSRIGLAVCIFSLRLVFLVLLVLTSCLCFLLLKLLIYLGSLQKMTLSTLSLSFPEAFTGFIFFRNMVHLKVSPS
jgi:hypothetical protein